MPKYKVFFQIYGNKMCKEVEAKDKYAAEKMIQNELMIDEVRKMDNEPEPKEEPFDGGFGDRNPLDVFKDLFGGFKK